jgi:hypothetical protein
VKRSLRAVGTYLLAVAMVGVVSLFGGPAAVGEAALAPASFAVIYEGGGFVGISPPGPFVGAPGDSLQTLWDSGSDGCCIRLTLLSGPAPVSGIAPGASVDGCCGWQPVLTFTQAGTYHFGLVWVPRGDGAGPPPPPANTAEFDVVIKAPVPTGADQCKGSGWQTFGVFKNQGDCVSFVATKAKNQPAG